MSSLNEFQYILLPANPSHRPDLIPIHNHVFKTWSSFWSSFLKESGGQTLNNDLLTRQNVLVAIMAGDRLAATHLYTYFDLNFYAARTHHFFSSLTEGGWEFLSKNNVSTFLTLEMLHVEPTFRKSVIGFSLAECLIGLGFKYMNHIGFDAGGGTSRSLVKVDQMANNFNLSYQQPGISKMNHDCTYQIGLKGEVSEHPDFSMRRRINEMWDSRVNLIENTYEDKSRKEAL